MDGIGSAVSSVTQWTFLNEPLYRWAIFIVAISMIMFGYNGILNLMK
jgi:hypothetical protein